MGLDRKDKRGRMYFTECVYLLIAIEDGLNKSEVAKIADVTYSHATKRINDMEREGFIRFKKEGRVKKLTLTTKGMKFKRLLDEALVLCDE